MAIVIPHSHHQPIYTGASIKRKHPHPVRFSQKHAAVSVGHAKPTRATKPQLSVKIRAAAPSPRQTSALQQQQLDTVPLVKPAGRDPTHNSSRRRLRYRLPNRHVYIQKRARETKPSIRPEHQRRIAVPPGKRATRRR